MRRACSIILPCAPLVGIALSVGGCGTVASGTYQNVAVTTLPPGAKIEIPGEVPRTTPASVLLPRRQDSMVTISKPGYRTETFRVLSVIDGEGASGVVKQGFLGVFDLASGAAFKLVPDKLDLTLVPLDAPKPADTSVTTPARGTTPASASPSADAHDLTAERLRALDKLKAEGLVTPEEYTSVRGKILNQIAGEHAGLAIATPTPAPIASKPVDAPAPPVPGHAPATPTGPDETATGSVDDDPGEDK